MRSSGISARATTFTSSSGYRDAVRNFSEMSDAEAEDVARRYAESRKEAISRLRARWERAGLAAPVPGIEHIDRVRDWYEAAAMGGVADDGRDDLPVWWDERIELPWQLPRRELPVTGPFVRLADEVGAWIELSLLAAVPSARYGVAVESARLGTLYLRMPALLLTPGDTGTPGWDLAYIMGSGPATRPSRYRRETLTPWSKLLRETIEIAGVGPVPDEPRQV